MRKIWIGIFLALLLAAAGGGYVYYTQITAAAQATAEPEVQTAVVRRGSLVISASGTGTVIAKSELSFGFDESGILSELLVAVGDEVKKGDVLARLQTDNTEEEIAASIADAELNVLKNQQALDDLLNEDISLKLAQAEQTIITAQETLSDTLEDRQRLDYARCLDSTIESYEAQYLTALNRYEAIHDNYYAEFASRADNDPTRLQALSNMLSAEESVQKALANLNWCKGTATADEIAAADAAVNLAKASLKAAQAELESLKNYPDPVDVAVAKAQLTSSEAKLKLAQETQSVVELTSPMDGTVLSISAVVSEKVGSGALFTVADLSQPTLQVYLDESDLNNVGVGYEIEVVFDALPDQTFIGHITSVDPSLSSMQNVTAVRATAQLDQDSFAKAQTLPIGLNASVEVIGSRAENVLLVPVEALREITSGSYGVFVMENGQPRLKLVEVGLMDYTYAEIKSGLNEGDVVTTGVVETGQ